MIKFSLFREAVYKYNTKVLRDRYMNLRSPYTYVKCYYYIETASLFLFITQKIIKSPNFVTFLYILSGVMGAFLLNSSIDMLFYIGAFMVFTKGTFDWADGPLARRLNKTSFLGHALDDYGAYVSDAAFRLAFIYYTFGYFPELMYLFPIVAFTLLVNKLNLFSDYIYYKDIVSNSSEKDNKVRNNEYENIYKDSGKSVDIVKWYYRYIAFLDGRARSIDFLLLFLIIDRFVDYYVSEALLILSILIVLRAMLMYLAGIYLAFKVYKTGLY